MKRIIIYVLAFTLFFWIGLRQPRDMLFFEVLVGPYRVIGRFLRTMSLSKGWLNVLAVIMWLSFSSLPLAYLGYRIKRKTFKQVDLMLVLIAIGLCVVLYYGINPSLMVDHIDPLILGSMTSAEIKDAQTIMLFGLLSTVYAPLLIYGIIRFIHMEHMQIDSVLRLFVDFAAAIIIFDYAGISLAGFIRGNDGETTFTAFMVIRETLLFILMMIMVRYAFPILRNFDIRNDTLYDSVRRLYGFSLIYLVTALSLVSVENLMIFVLRENTDHIRFQFDFPLFALMIAGLLLLFGRYVMHSVEMRRENELMI